MVLVVLDGFGVNIDSPYSTWKEAKMPTIESLAQNFPFTTLQASGIAVGLPWGQEGNSEVGHLTMGAGRALYHHLPRIISSIEDGSFFTNPALLKARDHVRAHQSALHLLGLFSSGSVHAYADHLYALLEFAKKNEIPRVYLHLFTDGKDAPAKEAAVFIAELHERILARYPFARIASIMGRLYAMDRDDNWDRVAAAYRCLVEATGAVLETPVTYIENSYQSNTTMHDGIIPPACLPNSEGRVRSGDAVVFYNFREDSERELVSAFALPGFSEFSVFPLADLLVVTMTEYDKRFRAEVAFPTLDIHWPLARVISETGLSQLHIAETEKYAHVTYFFNGGNERSFVQEDRILIHSPRTAHFDEVPEMASADITTAVLDNIPKYDFILVNLANADIVGHTGNLQATARALEALDTAVGKIVARTLEEGGVVVITADHGNAEEKIYTKSGEKRTKHTPNPVPFFVVGAEFRRAAPLSADKIKQRYHATLGVITDVAPTILALMNLRQPSEMTGINLLPKILAQE